MRPREAIDPAQVPPLDRIVFRSPLVIVGAFRCASWHPSFRDSGPIENDIFVFPRRSVRLQHEGEGPFLADPRVVTLYNRGQRYRRYAVSDADDCEWFAVERGVLRDAVRHFDPSVDDHPDRPLRHPYGPCPPRVYFAQRVLYERLRVGQEVDAAKIEETVLGLLDGVLESAYLFWGSRTGRRRGGPRSGEIAEAARILVSDRLGEPLRLSDVASGVGVSVFHLCRAFRAATGETLHSHRNRRRLQAALERVNGGEDLTDVALDLGYSSHSHFSAAFRALFGVTPSSVRPGAWRPNT